MPCKYVHVSYICNRGPSEIDMVSVGQMFIYLDPSVQGGTYYRVSIRKVLQQQIVSVGSFFLSIK